MMKLVLAVGGTGGHIFPAIALAKKWTEADDEVIYIGGINSLEEKLTKEEEINFHKIPVKPLPRKLSINLFTSVASNFNAVLKARKILKREDPDIVVGTGGYVSGATVLAARLLNIKTLIHEQNSVPGLTNKITAKFVDKIALSYKESAGYFKTRAEKLVLTGNPVRKKLLEVNSEEARDHLGISNNKKVLLVMGGSQGAASINQLMLDIYDDLIKIDNLTIIHITGDNDFNKVKTKIDSYNDINQKVIVSSFINNIEYPLAAADLIISRAGAVTLAEITALGLPSILIPYPYATNNHQYKNAKILEESGAAFIYKDDNLDRKVILTQLKDLINNDKKLLEMSNISKSIGKPDALDKIYNLTYQMAKK
ncbi:MAG: undecaprenyldiphospho-muramoylpentapeptide beta-N-acetylglucosaminyltransferase [Halarsenatibacteraceae bacterium]